MRAKNDSMRAMSCNFSTMRFVHPILQIRNEIIVKKKFLCCYVDRHSLLLLYTKLFYWNLNIFLTMFPLQKFKNSVLLTGIVGV